MFEKEKNSMFHSNHSAYIKALYKNILAEGSLFFDDRARYRIFISKH
jgi:hypothetical protein